MNKYFFLFILFASFLINTINSKIPDIDNRSKTEIKDGIFKTYLRSMDKWDIPFLDLLENKSGAACIQWEKTTVDFLKKGIFDALGYSQNIPNQKASQIAAISGCKKMKEYYKLGDTCKCEVIVTNDKNVVSLPIKKFDRSEEFSNAVKLYKQEKYNKAYKKFEKLSGLGDKKSQFNLSVMFFRGNGVPQNFKKAYYWSLSADLYGEKKAIKLIKNSKKRLTKVEVLEVNEQLRENLENVVENGFTHSVVPLAKWYVSVLDDPDFDNSYKWLSVASALNIKNTKIARDRIFKNVKEENLSLIQEEADLIYNKIVKEKNNRKNNGDANEI